MKIMLIYPTPPQGVWPYSQMYAQWIPAGLSQMAAELQKRGHEVRVHLREATLVNCQLDFAAADAILAEQLREFRPDIVGLSIVTASVNESARLAEIINQQLGDSVKIIAGGPHVSALPEQTLRNIPLLAAVIIGEGEHTICQLADGCDFSQIDGLAYLAGGKFTKTSPRQRIKHLDTLSQPAWELFDMDFHLKPNRWMVKWKNLKCINIRTSRGCPNVCSFCAGHVTIGAGVRFHSAAYVLTQLQRAINEYKVEGVLFEDETFAADVERLFEICQLMRKSCMHKKLQWAACLRVDQVDSEILAEMKSAGCIQVEYGFESGSDTTLKAVAKGSSMEMNRRAVELTHQAGLRIYADIMFNLPGETAGDFDATIDFIRWMRPDVMSAVLLAPLPGTQLYKTMDPEQRENLRPEATAYHELPENMINFSAMSTAELLKKYRQTRKYLLTPTIHRQILRDCDDKTTPLARQIKKRLRSFYLRHPIRAMRLPRV